MAAQQVVSLNTSTPQLEAPQAGSTYTFPRAITGTVAFGVAGSSLGAVSFSGNTSGTVTVQPAAAAGTWTFTLPTSAGTNNYALLTNGSGVTSWGQIAIGSAVSGLGTGVATALGINVGSAGAFTTNNAANTFTASQTFNAATSSIYVGANGGNLGVITLYGNTSGSVTLKPAAAAGTGTVFQLPADNGTSGYVLQTNGSGVTSWVAGSGSPAGSDTQIQFNDGGSFGGDAGLTFNKTSNALTITGGTATASTPVLDITQTWNNGAVNFTLSKMTITNTASDGYGFFADWKVGTNSVYKFRQDGGFTTYSVSCNGVGSSNSNAAIDFIGSKWTICTISGGQIGFSSDASQVYAGLDAVFVRVAAGVIKVTNASTGASAIGTTPVTVANLPAAGTAGSGARAFVTDATATTFASTVSGGGSNKVPVYSDGTNWLIG